MHDMVIHEAATLTKPSIENTELFFGFLIVNMMAIAIVMRNGMPNEATTWSSP